jgi:hypothetical protein
MESAGFELGRRQMIAPDAKNSYIHSVCLFQKPGVYTATGLNTPKWD